MSGAGVEELDPPGLVGELQVDHGEVHHQDGSEWDSQQQHVVCSEQYLDEAEEVRRYGLAGESRVDHQEIHRQGRGE